MYVTVSIVCALAGLICFGLFRWFDKEDYFGGSIMSMLLGITLVSISIALPLTKNPRAVEYRKIYREIDLCAARIELGTAERYTDCSIDVKDDRVLEIMADYLDDNKGKQTTPVIIPMPITH